MPITTQDAADQIAAATQIITDGDQAQPGKWVHVQVIPGFAPTIPASSTITGTLGALGTLTNVVANTFVDSVRIGVKFKVTSGGQPVALGKDFLVQPNLFGNDPCDAADLKPDPNNPGSPLPSDPLTVAFLFKPFFAEDIAHKTALDYAAYEITISLCISVEGVHAHKDITIPVSVPPVEVPALFFLTKYTDFRPFDGDGPGWLLVTVKAASPLQNLNLVLNAINELMEVIRTLQALLGDLSTFVLGLDDAANAINRVPVIFFRVGNVGDLEDFDVENDANASLLFGIAETSMTLYEDSNFDKGDAYSIFTVEEIFVGGIGTGIGIHRQPNFNNVNWDRNETGESMASGFETGVSCLQWEDA